MCHTLGAGPRECGVGRGGPRCRSLQPLPLRHMSVTAEACQQKSVAATSLIIASPTQLHQLCTCTFIEQNSKFVGSRAPSPCEVTVRCA